MIDHGKEKARFIMKTEMLSGAGIAMELPSILKRQGYSRAGIVVDAALYGNNSCAREIAGLLEAGLDNAVIFKCTHPEPTYDYLDEAVEPFRGKGLDCIVGIGGGSTLDLSKGIATLLTNSGHALEYRGFGKVVNIPLPVIALPSTAGTGSEVTPYAVFIDTTANWKFGINTEYNYPRIALYDPGLLASCPAPVFASAGMDAMTHTLESFAAKNATVISRGMSMTAFGLLFGNLKKAARGDRSTETILGLMLGSGAAGIALMNSGAGPSGALSYPLGVYFDVPHGLAGSVFLPEVIKYNVENGYLEYSMLYDLAFEGGGLDAKGKSLRFAEEIKTLSAELGIPTGLNGFGVKTREQAKIIIDNSMQLKAAFEQNPVRFGTPEIEKVVYSLVK